ncbi:hypothetical protein TNIN_332881 [Trichonephila inaurata madagascariensis]|uniref:Uncharacterized protein n=1 Tax=Trichonephila inaurata madagascariensis TaxID=2747483 RepID=A0A8X6MGK5_9ARAC|nr:hypothetical protein TNIN_332881 [Trichonephila inaurata madagascariensis]
MTSRYQPQNGTFAIRILDGVVYMWEAERHQCQVGQPFVKLSKVRVSISTMMFCPKHDSPLANHILISFQNIFMTITIARSS